MNICMIEVHGSVVFDVPYLQLVVSQTVDNTYHN